MGCLENSAKFDGERLSSFNAVWNWLPWFSADFPQKPTGPRIFFILLAARGCKILISGQKRVFQHRVMVGGSSPDEDRLSGKQRGG